MSRLVSNKIDCFGYPELIENRKRRRKKRRGGSLIMGYTTVEIEALITAGYIPVGDPGDLHAIETVQGSPRTFATGTLFETSTTTTGKDDSYIQVRDIDLLHATMVSLYGSAGSLGTWYDDTDGWPILCTWTSNDFEGIYDGGNYSISNLYSRSSTAAKSGLFSGALNATLKNIRLYLVDIENTHAVSYTGSLVNISEQTDIINVHATGTVNCTGSYIGGLVGLTQSFSTRVADWSRIFVNMTVVGDDYVGVIAGNLGNYSCRIQDCLSMGDVTGDDKVGGMFGRVWYCNNTKHSGVYNNLSLAVVTGNTDVGGMVGVTSNSTYSNNYYDETISTQSDTGKGIPLTTSQLKTPVAHSDNVDGDDVYTNWSEFVWDFGTASDYPVYNERRINYTATDFQVAWTKYTSDELFLPNTINGGAEECYPVGVVASGGKYYIIGKQGDTSISMFESADGRTSWSFTGAILEVGDIPVGWKAHSPFKFEYNTIFQVGSTWHVFFGFVFTDGTSGVGHATAATIDGAYTIDAALVVDPDSNNILSEIGYACDYITAPEMVRVGDTWHWFFGNPLNGVYYVMYATSPNSDWLDLTFHSNILAGSDFDSIMIGREQHIVQAPRIHYTGGYYYMTLTIGGDNASELGQRSLFVLRSNSIDSWDYTKFQKTPILEVSGAGNWDSLRVYCHDILKDNDGYNLTPTLVSSKVQMYYAGHSIVPYSPANTGIPGLCEI